MNDYKIVIPTKKDWLRHPKLLALKGVQIGPAFSHPDPERELGMRGLTAKRTKNADWMKYRAKRRIRNKMAHESRMTNAKR